MPAARLLARELFADKAAADDLIRAGSLDWTLVFPATLTNGLRTGRFTAVDKPHRTVGDRISRADGAHFMLEAAEGRIWSRCDTVLLTR